MIMQERIHKEKKGKDREYSKSNLYESLPYTKHNKN